jgi:hypothetical protein
VTQNSLCANNTIFYAFVTNNQWQLLNTTAFEAAVTVWGKNDQKIIREK